MARVPLGSLDAALVDDRARRVRREAHDVKYDAAAGRDRVITDGPVPTIDDWRAELAAA